MRILLTILVLLPLVATAESYTGGENYNPFANTIGRNPSAPPPVSVPSDAQFFSNTSGIFDNSEGNSQNGREYKLQDATRQGNAGMAAAIAAGSALSAAGTTQLLLGNLPEAARLFGLAGMEFAQAGVDGASSGANTGQRTTLLADGDQKGGQSGYNPSEVAQSLMTPETNRALSLQGIDPNSFLNGLASGYIQSPSQALTALGKDPNALSPDQLTAMNDVSGEDVNGIIGNAILGVNENAKLNSDGGAASGGAGSSAFPGAVASSSDNDDFGRGSAGRGAAGEAPRAMTSLSQPMGGAGEGDAKSTSGIELPAGIFPFGNAAVAEGAAGSMSRAELAAMGIVKAKGQNIFKVATRNFRSFSKWRALRGYAKAGKPAGKPVAVKPPASKPVVRRGIASIP